MAARQSSTDEPKSAGFIAWFAAMARALPGAFPALIGFSFAVNLLLLVSPLYMLQVYDRVLTSGSTDTLIWLTFIAVFLLGVYGAAEAGRRRISALAAERLEDDVSARLFVRFEAAEDGGVRLGENLTRLSRVRNIFANNQLLAFCDLPFAPLFLVILFLIHPVIGLVATGGAAIVFVIAILAEATTRRGHQDAAAVSADAHALADGLARQRSAMVAMGLVPGALGKWRALKTRARRLNLEAGAKDGLFASSARAVRQMLQVVILGAGAALAIRQEISPGAIVAGSILMSRALAPIDQIVGGWRSIAIAKTSFEELDKSLRGLEGPAKFTPLPRPEARLDLDRVAIAAPGVSAPLLRPFSLSIEGGKFVCLVGGNGVGKSTLLQTLAGAWSPRAGGVSLGGRSLHAWPSEDRGPHIGYIPQDVELLPGTIAENIARMGEAAPEDVFAAAQAACAHQMILSLPDGYETMIGARTGARLSAGQRQLIGLARALFGAPRLILLDEPTANLDPEAAAAVGATLKAAANEGAIVIAAAHDRSLIAQSDTVLLIRNGAIHSARTEQYLQSLNAGSGVATSIHGAGRAVAAE